MKNILNRWITVAIFLLSLTGIIFAGCSPISVGREFPAEEVSSILIGKTTREEIRERFGEPWRTGVEDGMTTWTFGYYFYKLSGEGHARDLVVKFDQSLIVRSYSFNTTDGVGTSSIPSD